MTPETPTVEIYTDGACRGNPGPGGWAAILRWRDREKILSGFEKHTTNNRMELKAVIEAFKALKMPCKVLVYTDSTYLKNGITSWIQKWKRNGWKTAEGTPVKNRDLWEELDRIIQKHHVTWIWVKGHSGNPENERCDKLAREVIKN
ncbi:MAG: ribonuclease HI [Deltaproteobacteria bacterium]|nr:ribonuclease HI [Deltaproteobacteria bacterium]MBW2067846.1 ribonuclease HI [Deltaproteobacteria bacterium]